MPMTPCRVPYCPNLTTRKDKGYCDDHKDRRTGWQRHQKKLGSNTQRGYGHQWQKLRKRILFRDGYTCVPCSKQGRLTPADAVDHIVPKSQGGTDAEDNLQSICNECHKIKTQNESQKARY